MGRRFIDLTGHRYGQLSVLQRTAEGSWLCRCNCGNLRDLRRGELRSGHTRSCGCLRRGDQGVTEDEGALLRALYRPDKVATSRNLLRLPEYNAWIQMRSRCTDWRNPNYPVYGGRGITICKRWDNFRVFLKDMGPRPSRKHSLGRKNNNGNYTPRNCRWETAKQQARNTSSNRLLKFRGRVQTVAAWAEELGMNVAMLRSRLQRGLTVHEALITHTDD